MTTLTRSAFKSGTPACPSGHRGFPDEAAARAAKKDATDFYPCSLCRLWHGVRSLSGGERGKGSRSPQKSPARDTGPSNATRQMVYEREGNACACCGKYLGDGAWKSIQHRVARGVGGGNDLFNLVLLCGSATSPGCHRRAEDRDREMQAMGFWLRSDEDPRLTPVMLSSEHGSGAMVWLTADGSYSVVAPAGAS